MKIKHELGLTGATVLLLLGVGAGTVAFAGEGQPDPAGASGEIRMLDESGCTLVPLPLRAPVSEWLSSPRLDNVYGTSVNWAGFTVATDLSAPQRGSVTAVAGSWIIPKVSFSGSAHTYSACWVGMDGSTVEQIGTEHDWTPRGQVNYVWFEMFPRSAYGIGGFPIAAGDVFGAGVTYVGKGVFVLSITNFTRSTAYTVPTRYTQMPNAQRSSAEWIVEAPYSGGLLPLANFGTVYFSNCRARINGMQGPIDSSFWQADAINMDTTQGVPKATPVFLGDSGSGNTASSSFAVQWSHQ